MSDSTLAWHWHKKKELRNGIALPPLGVPFVHEGPVEMCHSGLHASKDILDAFKYAPGMYISRVECRSLVDMRGDKLVCRERTRLWTADARNAAQEFARLCALDVIDVWNPEQITLDYLHTGYESIRLSARDAARRVGMHLHGHKFAASRAAFASACRYTDIIDGAVNQWSRASTNAIISVNQRTGSRPDADKLEEKHSKRLLRLVSGLDRESV